MMPSFGSGYRPDMTPPEKKPTLEEINAELLATLKGFVSSLTNKGRNSDRMISINHDELRIGIAVALPVIARAEIAKAEGRS